MKAGLALLGVVNILLSFSAGAFVVHRVIDVVDDRRSPSQRLGVSILDAVAATGAATGPATDEQLLADSLLLPPGTLPPEWVLSDRGLYDAEMLTPRDACGLDYQLDDVAGSYQWFVPRDGTPDLVAVDVTVARSADELARRFDLLFDSPQFAGCLDSWYLDEFYDRDIDAVVETTSARVRRTLAVRSASFRTVLTYEQPASYQGITEYTDTVLLTNGNLTALLRFRHCTCGGVADPPDAALESTVLAAMVEQLQRAVPPTLA